MTKITRQESQDQIDGVLVARMILDFKRNFRDTYPHEVMICEMMAVGPMQSFIGLAIKNGILKVGDEL